MGSVIRNNRATIICGIAIALLLGGLAVWAHRGRDAVDGLVALVHDGDGAVHELPLATDATLEVTTSLGSNTVVVEDGAVRVAQADCPSHACLRQRPLTEPGGQIICLPHRLWIEVISPGEEGGAMDASLVQDADDVDLVAR